jgi:hypothetical protein
MSKIGEDIAFAKAAYVNFKGYSSHMLSGDEDRNKLFTKFIAQIQRILVGVDSETTLLNEYP